MKQIISITAFLFLSINISFAQEAILTNGGDATGVGGSSSYSIGQVIYTTNFGVSTSSAQGVQQPYEISIISEVIESKTNLEINIYPNPTSDFLRLNIENLDLKSLSYELYDIEGKLITKNLIKNNISTIKVDELEKSTYFLKIIKNQNSVKTFKIIKN